MMPPDAEDDRLARIQHDLAAIRCQLDRPRGLGWSGEPTREAEPYVEWEPPLVSPGLRRAVWVALAVLLLALMAVPALAQSNCADRAVIVERLERAFGEHFAGGGLQSERRIIEVWASAEGTWTVLLTRPDWLSCVMASGTDWREQAPQPAGASG
jgi:hypothetical protein